MSTNLEKLEAARNRVSQMLTLAYATDAAVGPDEIRAAALVTLTPAASRAAGLAANLVLGLIEALALNLAGLANNQGIEALLKAFDARSPPSPRARLRDAETDPRPTCTPKLEPTPKVERRAVKVRKTAAEAKAIPKASSRWAEYGRRGGQVGGIKASPAKVAAARANGARGGRPRTTVKVEA